MGRLRNLSGIFTIVAMVARPGNTNRPRKGLCRGYEALVSCIIPWQLSSAAAQQTGLSGSED